MAAPSRRLHICVVAACPFPEPRGTPVRILRLSEAVASRGHRVSIVTYHLGHGEVPESLEVYRIRDVPSYTRTGPGPSFRKLTALDPMLVRRLRSFLRDGPVDVIHAHHYEGLLVALAANRRRSIPVVYDAHTTLSGELPEYRIRLPGGMLRGMGRWLDRRLPRLADEVLTVTPALRAKLEELGMDPERVSVAPQGVEDAFFVPPGERPADSNPAPTIVYAGNLAPYQGIDTLLEAFGQVHARRPGARLRILTGSSFEPYEAQAAALGLRASIDVESVKVRDLPAALSAADVVVNPRAEADGIPIKLLNYMAVGCPIVSFEGSFPIRGDEPVAALVPTGDARAFGETVLALLDDPARADSLGRAGRTYAQRHHRWSAIAESVEAVYLRLAREGRDRRTPRP